MGATRVGMMERSVVIFAQRGARIVSSFSAERVDTGAFLVMS
jgi:hypothetical protein